MNRARFSKMITFSLLITFVFPVAKAGSDQDTDPVAKLSWMAGAWADIRANMRFDEVWTPPIGGVMIGGGRTSRAGKTTFTEHLRIETIDGKPTYHAHFKPGQAGTGFPLLKISDDEVVFENLMHDDPKRIIYRKGKDADSMSARRRREGWQAHRVRPELQTSEVNCRLSVFALLR